MPLVARRKLRQSWRDAVAARAGVDGVDVLAHFDSLCREGRDEGEAAYLTLAGAGKLWRVDEPGPAAATGTGPDEVPAV